MKKSSVFIRVFLAAVISINCFNVEAQENIDTVIRDVTKLTVINPGLSYEKRVGKFQSLHLHAFYNTSAVLGYSSAMGWTGEVYFDPAVTGQYRYYYNYTNRSKKGKRTEMNSLNYLAGVYQGVFSKAPVIVDNPEEDKRRGIHSIGAVWGIQRNYKSRFSLDLNLGLGYLFTKSIEMRNGMWVDSNYGTVTSLGQINIGFWLNRKQ